MKATARLLPLSLVIGSVACAGPPYVTDDPEPPEPGKWEIYSFVEGVHAHDATEGSAGFDINYGAAKDLQLTIEIPVEYERGDEDHSGLGDIVVAVKRMFIHQHEGTWVPDVAFYPEIGLPTGADRFTTDKVSAFFPLWAQKDIDDWSLFGGGGYGVNPGDGNKDYWLTGFAVTRQVTEKLNIGAEIYRQTADEVDGESITGVGAGMEYELGGHWALLASIGPQFTHGHTMGTKAFYVSLAFAN
ncbi:MAG: transporter [Steroidobacteraceae bacterium]